MIEKITNAITPLKHVDKINEVIDKFNSFYKREVGEILPIVASADYIPDGCLPCDGSQYSKAQFPDLWNNFLINGLLNTVSLPEWLDEVGPNKGNCTKFGIDINTETFRVPLINGKVLTDIDDILPVAGSGIALGLTNGTNNYGIAGSSSIGLITSSVGYGATVGASAGNTNTSQVAFGVTTDSTKSGIIADTTNAKTYLELRYFVVVANGQTNQSMMDWSAWASSLQGKANVDLSNVDKVALLGLRKLIEVSDPSLMPSWYKVFEEIQPDGSIKLWCEQGGVITPNSTGKTTYNFAKEFFDENYLLFKQYLRDTSSADSASQRLMAIAKVDATSFSNYDVSGTSFSWQAKGFIN